MEKTAKTVDRAYLFALAVLRLLAPELQKVEFVA